MNSQRALNSQAAVLPAEPSLLGLPMEVFLKILSERDELMAKKSLRSLRLVCRKVDNMVKHLALESITLPRDPAKVQAMASRSSSFDTLTRVLRLEGHHYPSNHKATWQNLTTLVRKMKALHTIQWVDLDALNRGVRAAMARLPLLKTISFVFLKGTPGFSLTLSQPILNRITSLSFQFACFTFSGAVRGQRENDTMAAVRRMIVASAALERLELEPGTTPNPLSLASIADEYQAQHKYPLSLRVINARALVLPNSPNSTQFLSRLTSLQMCNNREFEDQTWFALHTAGIRLKVIKVEISSQPMADYIRGYQGLNTFHVGGPASDRYSLIVRRRGVSDLGFVNLRKHVTSSLPSHRQTLRELRFLAGPTLTPQPDTFPEFHLWFASHDLFTWLHRFHKIEMLDIVLSIHLSGFSNQLVIHYLNMLTSLTPTLQLVTFTAVGQGPQLRFSAAEPLRILEDKINSFRFSIMPRNWRSLRVAVKANIRGPARLEQHISFYRFVYSVAFDTAHGKWGLKPSLDVTEFYNDHKGPQLALIRYLHNSGY